MPYVKFTESSERAADLVQLLLKVVDQKPVQCAPHNTKVLGASFMQPTTQLVLQRSVLR